MITRALFLVALGASGLAPQALRAQAGAADPRAGSPAEAQVVRLRVALAVPQMAVVRRVVVGDVAVLPDGRREVRFAVTVGGNCRWTLALRRRAWWDRRALPDVEVERADGTWVTLSAATGPVTVIPEHPPCEAETHTVRVRVRDADASRLLERLEFVVAPLRPS